METLEKLGSIAGIAGIAVGAFVLIFRKLITKIVFPRLSPKDAYKVIRMILVLTWSIAVLGILVWAAPRFLGADTKPTYEDLGDGKLESPNSK